MKATYTSIWDGDIALHSNAEYNSDMGTIEVLEKINVSGLNSLDEEYIELKDGTRLDAKVKLPILVMEKIAGMTFVRI